MTFQLFVKSLYCKPYVYLVHFNVLCTYLKHIFNRNGDTNIAHLLRLKAGGLKACMSVSGMEELGTWHFLWRNGELIGMLSGFGTVRFNAFYIHLNTPIWETDTHEENFFLTKPDFIWNPTHIILLLPRGFCYTYFNVLKTISMDFYRCFSDLLYNLINRSFIVTEATIGFSKKARDKAFISRL